MTSLFLFVLLTLPGAYGKIEKIIRLNWVFMSKADPKRI